MTVFFSIAGVSKRFRGLVAVDRVSCEVVKGEIFAVIGPNGAGKTTLFNMIAGALKPDEGAIAFEGERIDSLRPDEVCRRGIARRCCITSQRTASRATVKCRRRMPWRSPACCSSAAPTSMRSPTCTADGARR